MKYLIFFILFVTATISSAQVQYRDSLYSEIGKSTHIFYTHGDDTLKFDFYSAKKAGEQNPLLVYVHGGGFFTGERDTEKLVYFAANLAHRGYAVASVSYRLTMKGIGFDCDVETSKKIAAIDSASKDVNRAIIYIIERDKEFHIDKNKIIIAGSSAGAETVLNMAYVYENENLPPDFQYAGVIGMAGAVTTLEKINDQTAIPTQLFHGTGDALVPYSVAPHHYCNSNDPEDLMLYGSAQIAKRLSGLGTSYYFYKIIGGSHEWAGLPLTDCINEIVDFLYNDVVNIKFIRQTERIIDDL